MKNIKILFILSLFFILLIIPILFIFLFNSFKQNDLNKKKDLFKFFSIETHENINSKFYKNDTELLIDYFYDDIIYINNKWYTKGEKFKYFNENFCNDFNFYYENIFIKNKFIIINNNHPYYFYFNKNISIENSIILFNYNSYVFNELSNANVYINYSYINVYFNNFKYYEIKNSSLDLSYTFLNNNYYFENDYELIINEYRNLNEGFYDSIWSYINVI